MGDERLQRGHKAGLFEHLDLNNFTDHALALNNAASAAYLFGGSQQNNFPHASDVIPGDVPCSTLLLSADRSNRTALDSPESSDRNKQKVRINSKDEPIGSLQSSPLGNNR